MGRMGDEGRAGAISDGGAADVFDARRDVRAAVSVAVCGAAAEDSHPGAVGPGGLAQENRVAGGGCGGGHAAGAVSGEDGTDVGSAAGVSHVGCGRGDQTRVREGSGSGGGLDGGRSDDEGPSEFFGEEFSEPLLRGLPVQLSIGFQIAHGLLRHGVHGDLKDDGFCGRIFHFV